MNVCRPRSARPLNAARRPPVALRARRQAQAHPGALARPFVHTEFELMDGGREVDGRRLVFGIEGHDETERIVEGTHERFQIDQARFLARIAAKGRPT